MKSRLGLRRQGVVALAAAMLVSLTAATTSVAFAADTGPVEPTEIAPSGADTIQAPATFFTINAVLAKLDRERGRGPNAVRLAALTPPSSTATDAMPEVAAPAGAALGSEPFGLFTFRAPDSVIWRKWRAVEDGIARDQAVLERCRSDAGSCPSYAAQFLRLIGAVKAKSGRARLEEVNLGVNTAIRYVSDLVQHRELDRWSAPLASFATGKGDCEDYAIAKYAALREAGVPDADMRLLLVRDRTVRQDHAVLAARLDGRWLILDNRWAGLRDDNGELNFTPLFAINHEGVNLFAKPYAKAAPLAAEAAPAAAGSEWAGSELLGAAGGGALSTLPLLL
ncbi:transglutaminase-like cysteine peptidase [Bradyrhizobium sp. GCM10027634]|uniref:transglutaminase-like cysteine peptidase n=1 Tax=unclassified Bradyrhizobium TaxID=2631580 RepID=UPI00263BD536|nr:transglutaminase-like cysteine peptidase [Bradyrhizobium sp. WYCCWR 12677]MDN5001032.1 transglutaminase-like cysteine peptidase [Bradyrhizobium sp. WYCCWR 12677]